MPQRYLVTAALPYANGPVHIGHLAGCYLPADIFVRYLRSQGEDVKFICGSDEHGVPITIKARNEGVSPQQVVDKYHSMMKKSFDDFGISFDIYSRTTSEVHHQTAAAFFLKLYEKGVFTGEITQQYYDTEVKQFLADRYIVGTCPKCKYENAYGDQCEQCGSSLQPTDLINPKSKLSGATPVLKETKNWFLPLDKLQPGLQKWISTHAEGGSGAAWKPNVYGQCMSWLNEGLKPRAMTRDLDWGVKVPLKDAEGKVLYVWFDAPIGYISATKELLGDQWADYWQSGDSRLIHFIGKDNIVFHCIVFPAMLMAHGGFVLPDNVPANEFLNLEGDKISTSRNWAVWLHEYLEEFPGKQDVLRYVLCATAPETKDNDFTWKDFQARNNNELVAVLGNFVNRTMVLTQNYFNGKVPAAGEPDAAAIQCLDAMRATRLKIDKSIRQYRFREAQSAMMDLARTGNKYLADTEPWKLIKSDPEKTALVLNIALELTTWIGIVAEPFLPDTSDRILSMMNLDMKSVDLTQNRLLGAGHQLGKSALLFSRIEDVDINKQVDKLKSSKNVSTLSEAKIDQEPLIAYDDFQKLELCIATILEAEKVPKTDKLMKLLLDIGTDKRTVVSGIAHCYSPDEIIGRQVGYLKNLQPRKIKGIESHGMILMADDGNGGLKFVVPSETVAPGSKVS